MNFAMWVSLFVVLVVVSIANAVSDEEFCTNGIPTSIATAHSDDLVDIFYMEAPAFEDRGFGPVMHLFSGYHSAFGVVNRGKGINYTLEFYSIGRVINAVLPVIKKDANGTVELVWENGGQNCMTRGLNASYFNIAMQLVTTVRGDVFNQWLGWVNYDNATVKEYELTYVVDGIQGWNGYNGTTFWLNSSTCYDFNWRGFRALYQLGAKLNYTQEYKHDFIAYYAIEPPTIVNYSDPVVKGAVDAYYEALHLNFKKDTPAQFIEFLAEITFGPHFLHAYGYYWLLHLTKPYLRGVYAPQPLPG